MTRQEKYIMAIMADELTMLQLNEGCQLSEQVGYCLEWIRLKEIIVDINNQISIMIKQKKNASGNPDAEQWRELKKESEKYRIELERIEERFDWEFIGRNFKDSQEARKAD